MKSLQMFCPLIQGKIDSDLCVDVQASIDGDIPVSMELEDFVEAENSEEICHSCKYHL